MNQSRLSGLIHPVHFILSFNSKIMSGRNLIRIIPFLLLHGFFKYPYNQQISKTFFYSSYSAMKNYYGMKGGKFIVKCFFTHASFLSWPETWTLSATIWKATFECCLVLTLWTFYQKRIEFCIKGVPWLAMPFHFMLSQDAHYISMASACLFNNSYWCLAICKQMLLCSIHSISKRNKQENVRIMARWLSYENFQF